MTERGRRQAVIGGRPNGCGLAGWATSLHPIEDRTRNTFPRALEATLVWAALIFVLALVFAGPPEAEQLGFLFGSLLVPTLIGALAAWLIARRSSKTWPLWRLALVSLPFFLLIRLMTVAGQINS